MSSDTSPSSDNLKFEEYTVTTNVRGVRMVAPIKRYMRATGKSPGPKDPAVIMIFAHGAGFFKEMYEPTISDLLKLDDAAAAAGSLPRIREVWGMDCQNHGIACKINEESLSKDSELFTIWDYGDAIATLYNSGLLGAIDPEIHKVVLCGHSAGSVGVVLATSWFHPPYSLSNIISSLILVETPFSPKANKEENELYKLIEAYTPIRRDIWKSQEAAVGWMKSRSPFASWDPRVFHLYVKHGFRPLPTAFYPDKTEGVTLMTHRTAENVAFTGKRHCHDALYRLNQICEYIPVHLIYGAQQDMFDRDVQDSLIDPEERRVFASVARVKGAGHLVPFEAPDRLAAAIYNALKGTPPIIQSKL